MKALTAFSIIVLLMILIPSFADSSEEHSNIFLEANQAYNKEDYSSAISLYEKLLGQNLRNGLIYYNLGNCYYRTGEIGKAILSYRRSELYNPRDEDLKANLNYARKNTRDKINTGNPKILESIFFWYYNLNCKELFILFLILNGLFWSLAAFRLFKPSALLRTIVLVLLFTAILTGISAASKVYALKSLRSGVLISKEISVRSGNGINNPAIFKLHEGAEFKILDNSDGWLKIKLPHNSSEMKGWVEKKFVGIVD